MSLARDRAHPPSHGVFGVALFCALAAAPQAAQAQGVVEGRVVAVDDAAGIPQASVELAGVGVRITTSDGSFRFDDVEPGAYQLRVFALGYAPTTRSLRVGAGDTTVTVALDIAPLALDSLDVDLRSMDLRGEVLDRASGREVVVVKAEVRANQVSGTLTDSHGRFEFERVPEGAAIRIEIRAFGYLPVDTVVYAAEDEEYVFALEPDEVVQQMIRVQVRRLEERAAGRRGLMRPMGREELLRYAGSATIRDVLESEYRSFLGRLVCGLIDEQNIYSASEFMAIAGQLLPEEVERIEFIAGEPFPTRRRIGGPRIFQVRIYTRAFIQEMIANGRELREPVFVTLRPPAVCR